MSNVQQSQEQEKPIYSDLASASDALLSRWEDASEPSDQATEEATAEVEEETEDQEQEQEILEEVELDDEEEEIDPDEEQDETEDTEEEAEEPDAEELTDETLIDILVEGETKQASIKELKRLYGQEASLTRKSQQVAAQRKQAEENIGKTDAIMQKLVQQAEERYKPYSEVDMLLASKSMEDADFAQLRKEAQDAADNLRFIKEEANAFYTDIQNQRQQQMQEAATEAVKTLQEQIPDWSNQLYDDIRAYAKSNGLADVDTYVDPNVITIINKSRLFDQAKNVTTTKKKRVAKKVLKSKKAPATAAQQKAKRMKDAKARLQKQGNDIDDIAEILLQRWEQ